MGYNTNRRAASGDFGPIPREIHNLQDAVARWEGALHHAVRAVIQNPQFGPLLIDMIQGISDINAKQLPGLRRQYRQGSTDTMRHVLRRIAHNVPESRRFLVPFLQRHADCACGDDRISGELDEMFAGRAYTTPKGPSGDENKDYGGSYTSVPGPGKWEPKKKNKCFYQTGDEGDRCYTTTNGGPNGPKPDTGSAANRSEYNKKYKKQRWNLASERRQARVKSRLDSLGMMVDLRKKHGSGTKAYYTAILKEVKGGVIAPSAVVGGGLKNPKKVAIEWCQDHILKAKK